ncbi:MAG: STAS domain-containing protein [Chitinispirillales bacterium]|jgi:anti-anti-sigma factor|nr:STAS domain-containing protein [Chitinispirillales bacterium]
MDIGKREKCGVSVVDVVGKIDRLTDSLGLKSYINNLAEKEERIIALNLAQVTYLDSGALNVMIYCQNVLSKLGGKLVIIEPNEYVYDVLNVVGFDKLITIYSSEKEFVDDVKKLKKG